MSRKFLLNLQLFADSGTNVNLTTNWSDGPVNAYTGVHDTSVTAANRDMRPTMKEYYDTELLENARPQLLYAQLGKKMGLPSRHGKTVEWRKFNTFAPAMTPLSEGVIPTGKTFGMTSINVHVNQFGDYVTISDVLDVHAVDPIILGATEEMGAAAGETKDTLVQGADTIYSTMVSPNATSYAYTSKSSVGDDATDVFVMDSETDKELCHFNVENVISNGLFYYDDETIIGTGYNAGIVYLDLNTGDMDMIKGSEEGNFDWIISDDKKVALGSSSKEYARYDLVNKKLIDEGSYTEETGIGYCHDGFLTDGGETVFYWDIYGHLYRYRFSTGELEILFENYTILSAAASRDCSKLVLRCGDGYARVVNFATMEVEKEISFTGSYSSEYLAFSEDNTKLYMQGADYYFRIYDLLKDEYLFVSDDQWNAARYTRELPEENLFIVDNISEMILMDLDTYGIRGAAEYGAIYFEKTGYIVSAKNNEIYKFKVKTLEDLLAEAKEKYGDAKLSSEQRLKYKLY